MSERSRAYEILIVAIAAAIFLGTSFSPPHLMDDVDAVQAQISRNMLESGDWVTARLDGVKYLEKPPLKYWMIAVSYMIFGIHDWAARLPIVLSAVGLCWVVFRFGRWAFSPRAGFYAALALATCIGLFLFTRVLIADVILTLAVAVSLYGFLRCLDEQERNTRLWSAVFAGGIGCGLLLKGLIAAVFPVAAAGLFLLFTKELLARRTWRRLHPFTCLLVIVAIAAPWHILAIVRNPPYFDFALHTGPGHYRGFFWFYFLNEHVFRFLNMRYPRDYNTVPLVYFWLLHLVWLFPWSVFLPGTLKLGYKPVDRAGRTRLLALCWIGFVLVFFSFSTTQEYYSMPAYPAFALLLGCAMSVDTAWLRTGLKVLVIVCALASAACAAILVQVWNLPSPGDISNALTQNPDAYTSLHGHVGDLTLASFAYLRPPLGLAAAAFFIGAAATFFWRSHRAYLGLALMMILFTHAARVAMIQFDPYLSSWHLAEALRNSPPGRLIAEDQYYTFSSVFFYADTDALLLNGRVNNLEYGSNAPGAPDVFISDDDLKRLWHSSELWYLVARKQAVPHLESVVKPGALNLVRESGGKLLFSNRGAVH